MRDIKQEIRAKLHDTHLPEKSKELVLLTRELVDQELLTSGVLLDVPWPGEIAYPLVSSLIKNTQLGLIKVPGIEKGNVISDDALKAYEELENYMVDKGPIDLMAIGAIPLYEKYMHRTEGNVTETYEIIFMRVSIGLYRDESEDGFDWDDFVTTVKRYYDLYHAQDFMSSTPTLFNSAAVRSQLSSCYVSTVPDDLKGIYGAITNNAMMSKYAGGIGNDWCNVRATGSLIKGTNGDSQGIIPFLKVNNDTALAVNQGGRRIGSFCSYIEPWHLDIEGFLDLRKDTGDDRLRTHDMNTALWIPDLFMERVYAKAEWTLFSPSDVPDLHSSYGAEFNFKYREYERKVKSGELDINHTVMPALDLWKKMLGALIETGHPWMTFKDAFNVPYTNSHCGVINSSNLCTEIGLHTNDKEIAVCNLGSINLANFVNDEGDIDTDRMGDVIHTAIEMLDNVIDINFYPVEEAEYSNKQNRPIGLGVMGFQELLFKLDIPYESVTAKSLANYIGETIAYYSTKRSIELAKERGAYPTYKGSKWAKGMLPPDMFNSLARYRTEHTTHPIMLDPIPTRYNWEELRLDQAKYGIRNSNITAIAPTASISNICDTTSSTAPLYQNMFTKSNHAGEFPVENVYLINKLKDLGLYDEAMQSYLLTHEGSIQEHPDIPDNVKSLFKTAFEIDSKDLIDISAAFQRWYNQAISTTLFVANPEGPVISKIYKYAWEKGLKSTYYLRTRGASSSRDDLIIKTDPKEQDYVEPAVCLMEEGCESCQ